MPLKRFGDQGEAFHFSMLQTYISYCQRATKFTYVEGVMPEYRWVRMWAGTAIHKAIETIHTKNLLDIDDIALGELVQDCMKYAEWEVDDADVLVNWPDDDLEKQAKKDQFFLDAIAVLQNYIKADFNRDCKVLLSEAPFRLTLETPKTNYQIEGKLDQLRERPSGLLELVEYKWSMMPPPVEIQMMRDIQMNGYPVAVEKGVFTSPDGSKKHTVGRLPDIVTYYNLRDHLEYQKPTAVLPPSERNNLSVSYMDWFANDAETFTLDEIRERTGNNRLRAQAPKVYFDKGHQKGPGRHTIPMTRYRANQMEHEIKCACASMRLNVYLPDKRECPGCRHKDVCNFFFEGSEPVEEVMVSQATA